MTSPAKMYLHQVFTTSLGEKGRASEEAHVSDISSFFDEIVGECNLFV